VLTPELREFAAAPRAYLPHPDDATIVDDARCHLVVRSDGRWAGVCRLQLADGEVEAFFAEVAARAPDALVEWIVAEWATPADLVERLRTLGCREPGPPYDPVFSALATDREPPAVDGFEIRRVETFEDFLAGLEVQVAASPDAAEWADRYRADAERTWQRRRGRDGGEWLAWQDGRAVGYAGAIAGPRGLFLTGGATVPEARGRGCYRALTRARWDDAVRRGTPGLVVHAQEGTSRPILEGVGFERVCTMAELASGRHDDLP
jgi:hypothetical protein